MEQAANRLGLRKLVVKRHSMLRWQYVHRNLAFFQKIQRFAGHVKALGHSTREHNDFCAMPQQFLHIGNLNAGTVRGVCLAPIPFPRAAGEKLCILVRFGFALDLQPAPRNVVDPWRATAALHDKEIIRTRTESKPVRRVLVIASRQLD